MAEEHITCKDLPAEHKKKCDELKAIREAELIGSFETNRSHNIKLKGNTCPSHGVNTIDLSHSIREPGFSFNVNMARLVNCHSADKAESSHSRGKDKEEAVPCDRPQDDDRRYLTEEEVRSTRYQRPLSVHLLDQYEQQTTDVAATATTMEDIVGLMQTEGIVSMTATTTGTNVAPVGGDGKLGYGFTSADELEEVDIGPGDKPRPTFISKKLDPHLRGLMIALLKEYPDCFAWDYTEMPGLDRSIIEHRLPLKKGFRPFQQRARQMKAEVLEEVKKEIKKMLDAGFIRPCRYAEWISNVVPVEKKDGRWRVAIDFRNLNSATPKDEYPMPVAETLINAAAGHKILSFMDGNAGYNQIFMAPEDIHKTAFRVPGSVGLFEYVVMTFGLKNAGATYQRAMNYIFHDLIGKLVEIYIDDVVVKSCDGRTLRGFATSLGPNSEVRTKNESEEVRFRCDGRSVPRILGPRAWD
ncbi:hypothetical protein QYE76_022340 [Lolium multiflorum]|uniref:Reverse transcriptase domain-containing protein n=1 Tax=Lolium multiflorum TaxID=4521 RepID=A0AAD8R893_LOLMU|nr:hypothetical protein QYE76_022340 [Lolium multiflorum]